MVAFDIASIIAEFVEDISCTSLELPHMTTGQRKSAKKMLEKHPDLRCESYGFGAERQLHLFKKCISAAQPKEDDDDMVALDKSNVFPDAPKLVLPLLREELRVRNTFIHMEIPSSPCKRAVQSMPHGMFRQCLSAEVSEGTMGYDTPSTACDESPVAELEPDLQFMVCPLEEARARPDGTLATAPCEAENDAPEERFKPGALVVVEGLLKAPAFNGRSAVVQGWDAAAGRYSILVSCTGCCQQAKVKEENLRMVLPAAR